jgi:hypothetical protein
MTDKRFIVECEDTWREARKCGLFFLSPTWTVLSSKYARTRGLSTKLFISLWASIWRAIRNCWGCGYQSEKFWLNVLTELQNRGVKDILIACVDGLKGFPDAINTAFPDTQIQLCIVHMIRNSMKYVPWKDYKAVALT